MPRKKRNKRGGKSSDSGAERKDAPESKESVSEHPEAEKGDEAGAAAAASVKETDIPITQKEDTEKEEHDVPKKQGHDISKKQEHGVPKQQGRDAPGVKKDTAAARDQPAVSEKKPSVIHDVPSTQKNDTKKQDVPKRQEHGVPKKQGHDVSKEQRLDVPKEGGDVPDVKKDTAASRDEPSGSERKPKPVQPLSGDVGAITARLEELSLYKPPPRPDKGGTAGRPIRLRANHFPVRMPKDGYWHHYDVEIKPPKQTQRMLPKKLCRLLFDQCVKENPHLFGRMKPVFDGMKNMFTADVLPFKGEAAVEVNLPDEKERDRKFKMTFKKVAQIDLSELAKALSGKPCIMPYVTLQALDIIFRHFPATNFVSVGRSFYQIPRDGAGVSIGGGRHVWFGYYQSVRPAAWLPMLNVDAAATAFYPAKPCIEFLCDVLETPLDRLRRPLNDRDRERFNSEIKGLRVQTSHTKIKYRVNKVTPRPAHTQTFQLNLEGGRTEDCTVASYFQKTYNVQLNHPDLPCLHVGNVDRSIYIPLELCRLIEGQKCNRKLTEEQTANMIRNTAKPAPQRERDINNFVREANYNKDPFLREFNISVDCRMADVEGRVLPPPDLGYGNEQTVHPVEGKWDMRNRQFKEGKVINVWAIVHFNYPGDRRKLYPDKLEKFVVDLQNIGRNSGMPFNNRPCRIDILNRPEDIERHFRFLQQQHRVELVVIVLRGKCSKHYAEVKRVGDTKLGMVTQCIQEKQLLKCAPATLSNICLKINAKLGGVNNIIPREIEVRVFQRPVIVLGADVTHPAPMEKMPSIAGMVGSLDRNATRYVAEVRVQESRQEIIADLADMTKQLLTKFFINTKHKPERIIFYRDGVSEGQFQQVLQAELTAVRKACRELEPGYQPGITFAVVQKRHHTRLFAADPRARVGKSGNVPPGTTVDRTIVHPSEFDFYLCSHYGIQGTSRPAKYHILWDDNKFTSDEIQKLTYQLCHTYVRCTRSVSIPAPAYYAHLVAFRARCLVAEKQYSSQGSAVTAGKEILIPPQVLQELVQAHADQGMYFA